MCSSPSPREESSPSSHRKPKRRNSDKRKEKSRDAARIRRAQESQLFEELQSELTIPGVPRSAQTAQTCMDKSSLIRLTLANFKCRDMMNRGILSATMKEESLELMSGPEMLDSMDSFCVALSHQMDVNYVSNNVYSHVGLTALELTGQPFYDYIHPCDHSQLKSVINLTGGENKEVYIRIKVTVTERGRLINLRQANYKVIKLSGRVRSFHDVHGSRKNVFLGLCHLIGQEPKKEHFNHSQFPLSRPFQTSHTTDMKFLDINPWLSSVGEYPLGYLEGRSFYEFIHLEDFHKVVNGFKNLYEQGQCEIAPYRFLIAGGGWIWLQTSANLVLNRKQRRKGSSITCTHTTISEVISKGDTVAMVQLVNEPENFRKKQKTENVTSHSSLSLALTNPNLIDCHYIPFSRPFTQESTLLESLTNSPETTPVASLCPSPLGSLHAAPIISPIPSLQITPHDAAVISPIPTLQISPEIPPFDNVHIIGDISPPETSSLTSVLANPAFILPSPKSDILPSLRTPPPPNLANFPTASRFLAHQDITISQSSATTPTFHSIHATSSVIRTAKKHRAVSATVTSNELVPETSKASAEQGIRIPLVISVGTTESYPISAKVCTESLLKKRSSVIVYSSSSDKRLQTSTGNVSYSVENQYKPGDDGNDNVEIEVDEKDTLSSLSNPDLCRSFYESNLDGHTEPPSPSSDDDVKIDKDEDTRFDFSEESLSHCDEQESPCSTCNEAEIDNDQDTYFDFCDENSENEIKDCNTKKETQKEIQFIDSKDHSTQELKQAATDSSLKIEVSDSTNQRIHRPKKLFWLNKFKEDGPSRKCSDSNVTNSKQKEQDLQCDQKISHYS